MTISILNWLPIWVLLTFILSLASCVREHGNKRVTSTSSGSQGTVIPDEYIVVMDNKKSNNIAGTLESEDLETVYSLRMKTEAVIGSKRYLSVKGKSENLERLKERNDVLYVEPNQVVRAFREPSSLSSNGSCRTNQENSTTDPDLCIKQSLNPVIWGLDRIDQRERVDTSLVHDYVYEEEGNGCDVNVYVVDTGIYVNHSQFEGRARWGFTTINMDGDEDLDGHGTHVAGIIGSRDYGVAKNANLIAVKVLAASGEGGVDGILVALQWIYQEFVNGGRPKSIMNLSLGLVGVANSLNGAVRALIDEGISVVIAAGNEYRDACGTSPAMVSEAITVGALNQSDFLPSFSNWGRCIDIFAPGRLIPSTYIGDKTIDFVSGTSQAAPHVVGAIARYMSTLDYNPEPEQVFDWVMEMSTKNAINFENKYELLSPNRILYIPCGYDQDPTSMSPEYMTDDGTDAVTDAVTVDAVGSTTTGSAPEQTSSPPCEFPSFNFFTCGSRPLFGNNLLLLFSEILTVITICHLGR